MILDAVELWLSQLVYGKSTPVPLAVPAHVEAAIEDGDQPALMMVLRHATQAQGGIAKLAREATYRMLSATGNLELRSLTAILDTAGLRLSVKPVGRRVD